MGSRRTTTCSSLAGLPRRHGGHGVVSVQQGDQASSARKPRLQTTYVPSHDQPAGSHCALNPPANPPAHPPANTGSRNARTAAVKLSSSGQGRRSSRDIAAYGASQVAGGSGTRAGNSCVSVSSPWGHLTKAKLYLFAQPATVARNPSRRADGVACSAIDSFANRPARGASPALSARQPSHRNRHAWKTIAITSLRSAPQRGHRPTPRKPARHAGHASVIAGGATSLTLPRRSAPGSRSRCAAPRRRFDPSSRSRRQRA